MHSTMCQKGWNYEQTWRRNIMKNIFLVLEQISWMHLLYVYLNINVSPPNCDAVLDEP